MRNKIMKYAIIYSSQTGNTEMLAEAIKEKLPEADCVYYGEPDKEALKADRIYAGFWTDKGTCDKKTKDFLKKIKDKEVFLFGTAGFGQNQEYFDGILKGVEQSLDQSNTMVGGWMCQGRMPMSVRNRYQEMLDKHMPVPNLKEMISNFDEALRHPNQLDLRSLEKAVSQSLK